MALQIVKDEVEGALHYIRVGVSEGGKVIYNCRATVLHNHSQAPEVLDDCPLSVRSTPPVLALELHNKWARLARIEQVSYNVQHMSGTCWDVGEVIESCLACADITFFCNWMHVDGSCPVFTLKGVGDTILVQHKVIAATVEMLCHHFVKVAYLDSFH